jgi:paraquat-inducible protein B
MSAKTHPRAVGVFVLVAVALMLTAVVLLSSRGWFVETERFSVYFPGSVRGLNRGATVSFRGVRIGEVVDVRAILTGQTDPLVQIEVVLEMRRDLIEVPEGRDSPFEGLRGQDLADVLIRRGLRARMLSASLLTGQRYIELDFSPDDAARLAGLSPRYPELPTTPTAFEKLGEQAEDFFEKLAELPLGEMLEDVRTVIRSTREIIDSDELRGAFSAADRSISQFEVTLRDTREALASIEAMVETIDSEVTVTAGEARTSLEEMRASFAQAQTALTTMQQTLRAADDTRIEASRTLAELGEALRVMRNLAEYIQTHPEAFVLGKSETGEEK